MFDRRRRLLWEIFPPFIGVAVVALFAICIYGCWVIRSESLKRIGAELERHAQDLGSSLLKSDPTRPGELRTLNDIERYRFQALCRARGQRFQVRIRAVSSNGEVLCDSFSVRPADHAQYDAVLADQPELRRALSGVAETKVRATELLGGEWLHAAVPLGESGSVAGAIVASTSLAAIDSMVQGVRYRMLGVGLALIGFAALVSWGLAQRLVEPLWEMRRIARRFARGDLTRKLPMYPSFELGGLSDALNRMASHLDERMRMLVAQRNEQETVLSSMIEGVIAVDTNERLVKMNPAAAELLGVDSAQVQGRPMEEVLRNYEFQSFIREVLTAQATRERSVIIEKEGERFLQLHGTVLRDATGDGIGMLLVINDLTDLRRLEGVRRDFVANVSHELRTPITSIKGFVETLLDGALESPEDTRRFLDIIGRHTDRLQQVIDDLLKLARIEQGNEQRELERSEVTAGELLSTVRELCEPRAKEKNIQLVELIPESMTLFVNRSLIEQAILNLVDNAIGFSEAGSSVTVKIERDRSTDRIEVLDSGPGIAPEHLARIFERFYRVDKGRARKTGGTGLGLAIVKHVARVHGGDVKVFSEFGKGCRFVITLPHPTTVRAA